MRYRHTDSDLYRLARQQQFVKALKQQMSSNFSVFKALKVVGAITHNVEIGQAGGGSLENTISATRSSRTACRRGTSSSRRSTSLAGHERR